MENQGCDQHNTPIPALHDLWRAGPWSWSTASTYGSRNPPLRRRSRRDPHRSRVAGREVDIRACSTLTFLEDVAHVSHATTKKPLNRARTLNPSHQTVGSTIPACAPLVGAAAAEGAIGAGQIDAIITTMKAIPTTMSEHGRTGAEKTVVDLACDTGPRGKRPHRDAATGHCGC